MNETQVHLSAGAGMVGMPTGPEAGRREPVREEKKGKKHRIPRYTPLLPLTP